MNSKWYIGILIGVLTLVGIGINPSAIPNQEIVLEYNQDQQGFVNRNSLLDCLREQLLDLDASNIKIARKDDGSVRITYHSNLTTQDIIASLKDNEGLTSLGYPVQPKKSPQENKREDVLAYKLAVKEITKDTTGVDFNGAIVESQTEGTRYLVPEKILFAVTPIFNWELQQNKVRSNFSIVKIAITQNLYTHPEGRAGPLQLA